jgi:hypothetical protein
MQPVDSPKYHPRRLQLQTKLCEMDVFAPFARAPLRHPKSSTLSPRHAALVQTNAVWSHKALISDCPLSVNLLRRPLIIWLY